MIVTIIYFVIKFSWKDKSLRKKLFLDEQKYQFTCVSYLIDGINCCLFAWLGADVKRFTSKWKNKNVGNRIVFVNLWFISSLKTYWLTLSAYFTSKAFSSPIIFALHPTLSFLSVFLTENIILGCHTKQGYTDKHRFF